ncbi:phage Gp37/Gp68 family protein [Azospirillum humicireducens]|nr:phage Gp37/Gp68 family protein [Azospirillum humicireducens]
MTTIEWTKKTWNPLIGCKIVSAGCTNCYAQKMAHRLAGMRNRPEYKGLTERKPGKPAVWSGVIRRNSPKVFRAPVGDKRGSVYFVNSMSDLFYEEANEHDVLDIINIMNSLPHHIFQVLTKRPGYAADFIAKHNVRLGDHVWIGTSVENAKVTGRVDDLRRIPARTRFLSIEPLIGSVGPLDLDSIHWVIAGGESGIGARPCSIDWVRDIRDQCIRRGAPFFFKQWGKVENNPEGVDDGYGKGGAMLDGILWRQFPSTGHPLDMQSDPPHGMVVHEGRIAA